MGQYKISSKLPAGESNMATPTSDRTPSDSASIPGVGCGPFFPDLNAEQPGSGESQHGPYGAESK